MANEVCYRTLHLDKPWAFATYQSVGGYDVWRKIIQEQQAPQKIIDELKASGLRGRGGAGFPTGLKWSFMPPSSSRSNIIVCNSDEGEPGTCKDRDIMRFNPHQLIEGMLIACYTMNASLGYNYIRGEYYEAIERFEQALQEARDAGLMGKNILGSGIDIDIHAAFGAGAYICGEETALMNSLEGKKGQPRFKPPFPANFGVYGRPTTINNTETLASVPVILQHGGKWFADLGNPPNSGGCRAFSVSGHVQRPGNFELPLGTPFADLLELAGGMLDGSRLKAVIPGGVSMPVLPADIIMNTTLDYDVMQKAGSSLGSGAVIVMNEQTCMVRALWRISEFYSEESCGQCTPCREGTGWIARTVHAIEHGHGTMEMIDRLASVAKNMEGRTICALADAAAWPVAGFLKHYRDEFIYHVEHKKCLAGCQH